MYVERTHYYAKPGKVDAVRVTRKQACDIRDNIGLERGAIYHKADPDEDGPDVTWQCEFSSREAHEKDLAARAKSPEFKAIRRQMRANYDRFERHFQKIIER